MPALLQGIPETSLTELCLESYEISPVEPLNDLRGHLHNVIAELRVNLTGEAREKVESMAGSVLNKDFEMF